MFLLLETYQIKNVIIPSPDVTSNTTLKQSITIDKTTNNPSRTNSKDEDRDGLKLSRISSKVDTGGELEKKSSKYYSLLSSFKKT